MVSVAKQKQQTVQLDIFWEYLIEELIKGGYLESAKKNSKGEKQQNGNHD